MFFTHYLAEQLIRFLWNWIFTHESLINSIGYLYFLNLVCVKFVLGKTILSLCLLYTTNYLNWVSSNYYAFCYLWFEKQLGIPEFVWVKTGKRSLLYLFLCKQNKQTNITQICFNNIMQKRIIKKQNQITICLIDTF